MVAGLWFSLLVCLVWILFIFWWWVVASGVVIEVIVMDCYWFCGDFFFNYYFNQVFILF